MLAPRSTKKLFKSARILSEEKILKLGTSIEIATWRRQDQAICGSGLVHACLDSSEEIDCPSSNGHNFRSFASIELIFCLNRSRIRRTFRKTKPQRAVFAPGGAVLCRLPSVSCLFLLVEPHRDRKQKSHVTFTSAGHTLSHRNKQNRAL